MTDLDSRLRADARRWQHGMDSERVPELVTPPESRRTPRLLAAAAAVFVIGLGAALVASFQDHRDSGSPNISTATASPLPTAPVSVDPLQSSSHSGSIRPVPIVTSPSGPGLVSSDWSFVGLSDDGRVLTVEYEGAVGCTSLVGFSVIETSDSVELINYNRNTVPSGTCAGRGGASEYGTVTLTKPLLTRSLLHAPTSTGGGATVASHPESLPTAPASADSGPQSGSDPLNPHRSGRTEPAATTGPVSGDGLVSMGWNLVSLAQDGRTLTLDYYTGGGCTHQVGFRVYETSTSVELLNVGNGPLPTSGATCSADLRVGAGTVTLAKPLGTRRLLHAPTNWPPTR